ncbi:MAG: tyrosine recombinase [Elusimicrobia bacterium CG08_land_8_20_14_0_20_51_18]|nr:MAG: tyrosine recombinase [Elusimicrobia bacterium CG08_land_8_20_14_0_20_51_18]
MLKDELISIFKRYIALEKGLSKNTAWAYSGDIALYFDYCSGKKINPLKINTEHVESYLCELKTGSGLKAASLFRKAESLKAFYKFLAIENKIAKNPLSRFKAPRLEKRLPKTLSPSEVEALLSPGSSDKFNLLRTSAIAELLYASGIRVSELADLRLESLNLSQGWIRVVGKGDKERIVPVHKRAVELLIKYIDLRNMRFAGKQAASEVFLNKSGKRISRIQIWKDLKTLARAAGISKNMYPHLLRHSFATHLLQRGADLRSIGEILGHASLNTTQIYTHLDNSAIKSMHKKYHPKG